VTAGKKNGRCCALFKGRLISWVLLARTHLFVPLHARLKI
jgi:hypothetical protein